MYMQTLIKHTCQLAELEYIIQDAFLYILQVANMIRGK